MNEEKTNELVTDAKTDEKTDEKTLAAMRSMTVGGPVVGGELVMVVSTAEAIASGEFGGMSEWEVFKRSLS